MTLHQLQSELRALADHDRTPTLACFFKTYEGGYVQDDQFLSIAAPTTRSILKKYIRHMALYECEALLASPYHEERLAGAFCLVYFAKRKKHSRDTLADFYMSHISGINNRDLVDCSAEHLIGAWLATITHAKRKDCIDRCIKK